MRKRALITGINGMDGSHLADFLLDAGYEVFGMERRHSFSNRINTQHLVGKIEFLRGDLTDQNSLVRCIKHSDPDEIYNLAAQSFVKESWNTPDQTSNVTALGTLRMLEAIREYHKPIKFYQASSSEMFGTIVGTADENTRFYPRSPYGVSKLYAHWITRNYRESYGMFNVSGILFNHESERRGFEFVTRKITDGVARIKLGLNNFIELGNLDVKRDWGYAPDYVEAMWLMLQQDLPIDYVIATGNTHSVRDFLKIAFSEIGITDYDQYVKINKLLLRPAEIFNLAGDYSKAKEDLGWNPKMKFKNMISRMVQNDINLLKSEMNINE